MISKAVAEELIEDIKDITFEQVDMDTEADLDSILKMLKEYISTSITNDVILEIDDGGIYVSNMDLYSDEQLDIINGIVNQALNLNGEILGLKN